MLVKTTMASNPIQFLDKRAFGCQYKQELSFITSRFKNAKNLFCKDLKSHFGCVNGIEFSSNGGEWIASGGDDMRVLLWKTEKAMDDICKPVPMNGQHHSNIFCLAFDCKNEKIFSGGNDEQVVSHDLRSGETLDVYTHNEAVYGLSASPTSDNIFASACDDGRILIYDTRAPPSEDPFCLANYMSAMHAVMFNPMEPRLVATANSKEGLGLWDVRKPRTCLLRYGGSWSQQSCMSVRISSDGKRVIGLRRRLPPVLYNIDSSAVVHHFDHAGYYNSCTMKSCCFAGDKDQYLISGSDDFNLYVWKIPDERDDPEQWVGDAHLVLKGHRSIVNQVRFNPANHLIISSGVEKVVKMWSPYALPNSIGALGIGAPHLLSERAIYSHDEYINLVLHSGHVMSHDYSTQSTEEDPRMMAFFDSLVQRELENWSSSDDDSLDVASAGVFGSQIYSASSRSPSPDFSHSSSPDALTPFEISASLNASSETAELDSSREGPSLLDMDEHAATERLQQAAASAGDSATASQHVAGSDSPIHQTSVLTSSNDEVQVTNDASNNRTPPAATSSDVSSPVRRRVTVLRNEASTSTSSRDNSVNETLNQNDEVRRTNISNLIKMKRKEYIEGIKKQEVKARRRHERMQRIRKERVKRIRQAVLQAEQSSSSSDSSSESSESQEDTDVSTSHENTDILKDIASERQKRSESTVKLKELRKRVARSDLESSDSSAVANVEDINSCPLDLSYNGRSCNGDAVSTELENITADKNFISSGCKRCKAECNQDEQTSVSTCSCSTDCLRNEEHCVDSSHTGSCHGAALSCSSLSNHANSVSTDCVRTAVMKQCDIHLNVDVGAEASNGHRKSHEADSPMNGGVLNSSALSNVTDGTCEANAEVQDKDNVCADVAQFKKPKSRNNSRNYRKHSHD